MSTRIYFSNEQHDLLDDMIAYYVLTDFGGGSHSEAERLEIRRIRERVTAARDRVGKSPLSDD